MQSNRKETKNSVYIALTWVILAKHFRRGGDFLLENSVVFLLLGVGLEALPGQAAAQEVHQHEAQRLDVVAAALLDAQVCVN